MNLTFFDVEHGQCALVRSPCGRALMVDCGQGRFSSAGIMQALGIPELELLIISNFDQDHVAGLPELRAKIPVRLLLTSKALTVPQLRALKQEGGPLSAAMESMLDMRESYTGTNDRAPIPNIEWRTFAAPASEFTDTNNLSLVTELNLMGTRVLFPGDLEEAGWLFHLKNSDFRQMLERVDILVASHHGRENGFCRDVFQFATPKLVVISDCSIAHETQRGVPYGEVAQGLLSLDGINRKVLSTRNDGMLHFSFNPDGFIANTESKWAACYSRHAPMFGLDPDPSI